MQIPSRRLHAATYPRLHRPVLESAVADVLVPDLVRSGSRHGGCQLTQYYGRVVWPVREFGSGTVGLGSGDVDNPLASRHIHELGQVKLVRHSDCRGRTVTVLTQNQVGFTATGIVSLSRVRAIQQDHHVCVLLE